MGEGYSVKEWSNRRYYRFCTLLKLFYCICLNFALFRFNCAHFINSLYFVPSRIAVTSDYVLAGSALPSKPSQLFALYALGIRTIITVLEEPLSAEVLQCAADLGVACHHFAVDDRTPPSEIQLTEMCRIIDSVIFASGKLNQLSQI